MRPKLLLLLVFATIVSSCNAGAEPSTGSDRPTSTTTTVVLPEVPPLVGLTTELVADGLDEPVTVVPVPPLDTLLVAERIGRIVEIASDGTQNTVLDVVDRVGWDINEQGFLAIAAHPDFPDDPRIVAIYTNIDRDVVVSTFDWTGDTFDPNSETPILTVPQPHQYHQGGGIVFGPAGYLWMSFGDGGGNGDPYGNGQNPFTLNGTVVRIDIDDDAPYVIPPSNPFADGQDGDPAVWAFGLRNPWRITIDDGHLIIADVGQYHAEEIDVVALDDAGHNFGWPIMEGNACYETDTCDTDGLTPPTREVAHDGTCAIIGGPVYRGTTIPEIHGSYVYGDFCTGWVRTISVASDGSLGDPVDWSDDIGRLGQLSSFGVDVDGELLIVVLDGSIHRVLPIR